MLILTKPSAGHNRGLCSGCSKRPKVCAPERVVSGADKYSLLPLARRAALWPLRLPLRIAPTWGMLQLFATTLNSPAPFHAPFAMPMAYCVRRRTRHNTGQIHPGFSAHLPSCFWHLSISWDACDSWMTVVFTRFVGKGIQSICIVVKVTGTRSQAQVPKRCTCAPGCELGQGGLAICARAKAWPTVTSSHCSRL